VPHLFHPTRSVLALLGTAAALGLAAGPADAARKTKPKPRADLTLKQLDVTVSDEGTVLVSGSLVNIGRKSARPSDLVIAVSDDDVFDDDDDLLDELGTQRLGAGMKRTIDDEVDIPLDIDTTDGLTVLVCADGYDDVIERNEANNCVTQEVFLDDLPVNEDPGAGANGDNGDNGDPLDVEDDL